MAHSISRNPTRRFLGSSKRGSRSKYRTKPRKSKRKSRKRRSRKFRMHPRLASCPRKMFPVYPESKLSQFQQQILLYLALGTGVKLAQGKTQRLRKKEKENQLWAINELLKANDEDRLAHRLSLEESADLLLILASGLGVELASSSLKKDAKNQQCRAYNALMKLRYMLPAKKRSVLKRLKKRQTRK